MKRIITLAISLLTVFTVTIGQNDKKEYSELKFEIESDSAGESIAKYDLEFYRILAKDNSSWGFKNKVGEIVIPLGRYAFLNPIDEKGMILAKKGDKSGYIDINENIIIPFIYDDVGVFSKSTNLAPVIKNGKQGFIDRTGEIIIPLEYDSKSYTTYFYEPGLAILMKNGKQGVIDPKNNVVIPFKYDKIEWSEAHEFFIVTQNNKIANFSLNGKKISDYKDYEIVPSRYYYGQNSDYKNLPILIQTKGNKELLNNIKINIDYMNGNQKVRDSLLLPANIEYAYIDKEGNYIVPWGKYDIATPFRLGRKAIVSNKGAYGIIDEYGKLVLPLEYDFIEQPYQYSNYADIFVATKGREITVFDSNLNIMPTENIISYINWNGNLIVSNNDNKKGIINYYGKQIIPCEYDTLIQHRISGYIAKKENLYGYISQNNKFIKPFDCKYIYEAKHDLIYVNQAGKVGIYDEKGKIKIPFEYDAIYDTWYNNFDPEKNRYIVVKDKKVGTIDIYNKVVIPLIYDALSGWVEYGPNAHFVRKDGKYGLISHEGDIIIPIKYEYVGKPSNGIIKVRKNGKYGVVSMKHKEVLPCKYNIVIIDIPYFTFNDKHESKIIVLENNIWSYYNINGQLLHYNIPENEILKEYDYLFRWRGELSNEGYDFDMKQHVIIELLEDYKHK